MWRQRVSFLTIRMVLNHMSAIHIKPRYPFGHGTLYVMYVCTSVRKEGNVLFNDALNTFYLRLYGVRHMVKDHSDNEKGNPLPPHRLLFPINSKGSFICTIPQRGYHIH